VATLVKPAAAVVSATTTLAEMFYQLPKRPLERVLVVNNNELVAWLDPRDVLERLKQGQLDGNQTVSSVAKPVEFALTPDMSVTTALEGFLREQAMVLPVTPGQWRNTLLGEVSRSDVLLAIQDRLTYPK
jgi:CBS domain-containing protein